MEDKKLIYFQYQKDLDIPVYLVFNLNDFSSDILSLLTKMRCQELSKKEHEEALRRIGEEKFGRILKIESASPLVASKINAPREGDYHGDESSFLGHGYRVYRYRGVAIMTYSAQHSEWSLGCFKDFGSEDKITAYSTVINRFLSYALAPLGIVGLWGVPAEGGVALVGQREGQAVFVDVEGRRIISVDGVSKIPSHFQIIRCSRDVVHSASAGMNREELLSSLLIHSTYLDYEGLTIPVRQLLQEISKLAKGTYYSEESFRTQTGLSL